MKQDIDGLGTLQREQARDLGSKIENALADFRKTSQGFFVKVVLAILGVSLVNLGAVVAIIRSIR